MKELKCSQFPDRGFSSKFNRKGITLYPFYACGFTVGSLTQKVNRYIWNSQHYQQDAFIYEKKKKKKISQSLEMVKLIIIQFPSQTITLFFSPLPFPQSSYRQIFFFLPFLLSCYSPISPHCGLSNLKYLHAKSVFFVCSLFTVSCNKNHYVQSQEHLDWYRWLILS